jgi:hypothetical protein
VRTRHAHVTMWQAWVVLLLGGKQASGTTLAHGGQSATSHGCMRRVSGMSSHLRYLVTHAHADCPSSDLCLCLHLCLCLPVSSRSWSATST